MNEIEILNPAKYRFLQSLTVGDTEINIYDNTVDAEPWTDAYFQLLAIKSGEHTLYLKSCDSEHYSSFFRSVTIQQVKDGLDSFDDEDKFYREHNETR